MKPKKQVIKAVAEFISPLVLSCLIVLICVAFVKTNFAGYVSLFHLFLQPSANAVAYEGKNIFEGYEGNKETQEDVIDGDSIQYPARGDLYARLAIETCGIDVDLYFDDSNAALKKGVGQYYGTRPVGYGTPILIAGHNNGAFHRLQYISVGDVITITTNYGIFEYQVRKTEVRKAASFSAEELYKDEEELILYTCHPFTTLSLTPDRFFVYADRISGPTIRQ